MTRASTGSWNWAFTIHIFTGLIHVGIFMSHTLQSIFYRVIYPTLYMIYPPLFLQSHIIPVFIIIIATPPATIFQNGMPNVVFETPSNGFRAVYHPYYRRNPTSYMHLVMYFLKISIPNSFFRSGISNPLLTHHPVFWPWLTHNQLQHLFISFPPPQPFFTFITRSSQYILSRWR